MAPQSGIEVLKMVLCKDLKDHEPGDEVKDFKVGDVAIGWNQIRSGLGEVSVTHRWRHNGDIISDVKLPVKKLALSHVVTQNSRGCRFLDVANPGSAGKYS